MTLSQAERAYFVRKAGGTQAPTKPLNQIKREYFASFVGSGNATTPFGDLETRWMLKVLDDAGVSTTNIENGTLWHLMVIAAGKTPVKSIGQNQLTFYLHAA